MRGLRIADRRWSSCSAGLGAYIYFVDSKKPEERRGDDSRTKVFAVKADEIDEITVKSAGGDTTTLKKDGGDLADHRAGDRAGGSRPRSRASSPTSRRSTSSRVVDENPADLASSASPSRGSRSTSRRQATRRPGAC